MQVKTADPPKTRSLARLRTAAASCRACPLWRTGTQTVFGEGGEHATLLVVGEQPGDREDIEGHPFVGPAGRLLGGAPGDARIRRAGAFLGHVVKDFKWK